MEQILLAYGLLKEIFTTIMMLYSNMYKGACGVIVIVVGNGYGDRSSNPGRV